MDSLSNRNRFKFLAGIIKEHEFNKNKKIYVLVGPPSVGKSTWIKNTFNQIKPFIINRDDIVEDVAGQYGWTYDDMFVYPPKGSEIGESNEIYGQVVQSPSYMNWQPLSYTKVLEANKKVAKKFDELIANAKGRDNIVVDMTNMNKNSRKRALDTISDLSDEYKKIAVVFNFKGMEELIKKVAEKRALSAKESGKSKTIGSDVFDKMFSSYSEVSPDEGFDEIIKIDNSEILRKSLENE